MHASKGPEAFDPPESIEENVQKGKNPGQQRIIGK